MEYGSFIRFLYILEQAIGLYLGGRWCWWWWMLLLY